MISTGQLTPILGVLQQRLIPSKLNDGWGFDLLEAIVAFVPTYVDFPLLACIGRF